MFGHEEHLRDSAPDNSRFDGFDRGDLDNPHADEGYYDVDGYVCDCEVDRAQASAPFVGPLPAVDFDDDIKF